MAELEFKNSSMIRALAEMVSANSVKDAGLVILQRYGMIRMKACKNRVTQEVSLMMKYSILMKRAICESARRLSRFGGHGQQR